MREGTPLTPEAELLCACLRAEYGAESPPEIHQLVNDIDTERFVELVQWHEITPQVVSVLRAQHATHPAVLDRLDDLRERRAKRSLLLTNELTTILSILDQEGITAYPYKGAGLADRLYGDVAQREFKDIDILVHPEDATRARNALITAGYHPRHELTPHQTAAIIRFAKDFIFDEPATRIELHWRYARPSDFPLSLATVRSRGTTRTILGERRTVPTSIDLFLILTHHGAKHDWMRLKWACDCAELHRQEPIDWQTVHERANKLGIHDQLRRTFHLFHDLFSIQPPTPAGTTRHNDAKQREERGRLKTILAPTRDTTPVPRQLLREAHRQPSTRAQIRYLTNWACHPRKRDVLAFPSATAYVPLLFLLRPLRLWYAFMRTYVY